MKRIVWPLLGCLMAPLVQAADDQLQVGAQLGAAHIDSEFSGPGSDSWDLHTGTGTAIGLVGAYNTTLQALPVRLTLAANHTGWDSADTASVLAGADVVWRQPDDSGGVYIGPRLGAMYFSDDITDDSNTDVAYGVEAGFLQSLSPLDPQLKTLQFGLYFRQIYTNLRNKGALNPGAVQRDIDLDSQSELGLQFLWQPE